MNRHQKKSVQTLNYLAIKNGGKINRLKALKLLWLADKYHLLMYGRTILHDKYVAMPHGPVPSNTIDISQSNFIAPYVGEFLERRNYHISSKKGIEATFFSKTDFEILDAVMNKFGKMSQWQLRDLTHKYPEWRKFEDDLKNPNKPNCYPMEFEDFYSIPDLDESNSADFFKDIPEGHISESLETLKQKIKLGATI